MDQRQSGRAGAPADGNVLESTSIVTESPQSGPAAAGDGDLETQNLTAAPKGGRGDIELQVIERKEDEPTPDPEEMAAAPMGGGGDIEMLEISTPAGAADTVAGAADTDAEVIYEEEADKKETDIFMEMTDEEDAIMEEVVAE